MHVPGRLTRMASKGRHPAGSRRSVAVLPVTRRQDEVRSGAYAVVSRYRLALHVRHLTLAEGSLVTRLLQRRRATRGRRASAAAQRRQRTQEGPVRRLPPCRAVCQDATVAGRSCMRLLERSSSGRRRHLLHGVLVLVAVAGSREHGSPRHAAGRHRRAR